jgi:transposase-like protein
VPARVSATDRIRTEIDALFAEDRELPEILEEVARLGAQLLMQAALEAEVTEFLGRERYQRSTTCLDANGGSRNGYRPVTVKTTTGPVRLERPKLRGTTHAFASRLFGKHVTKTNALETLVIAAFVRGLSVRDVEATLAEALGDQAAISKSTVSEVCKAIRAEYQTWARRRLDQIVLDYLFLDASFFRMHPGSPAEPVLAAWGITTEGKPVFVGLAPGTGESTDAWADFLTDLRDRGLATPLLIVSDGAKGLIAAIEQIYPKALRQRCLIHRLRNVLAKVPTGMQTEIRDGYWAIFATTDLNTVGPGPQLVKIIDKRIEAFATKYADLYPAAMRILGNDKTGLTAYLRFPGEHHGRVRHSNFIERCFGETKRRTKVIGRFPGETSAISLVWAVLDRASAGWRGLTMTPVGTRLLQDLRRSLLDPPRQLRPPPTTSYDTDQADPSRPPRSNLAPRRLRSQKGSAYG